MDIYERARNNIIYYRKLNNYTQQELADLSGYTHGYIRSIESKKVAEGFSLGTLENIAKALNVTTSDLVSENTSLINQ